MDRLKLNNKKILDKMTKMMMNNQETETMKVTVLMIKSKKNKKTKLKMIMNKVTMKLLRMRLKNDILLFRKYDR
jgi:hypothetical protein